MLASSGVNNKKKMVFFISLNLLHPVICCNNSIPHLYLLILCIYFTTQRSQWEFCAQTSPWDSAAHLKLLSDAHHVEEVDLGEAAESHQILTQLSRS